MLNRELANRARAAEAQKLLLAYEAARRHRSVKDTAISLQVDRKTITRLRSGSHSPNRKLWEALAEGRSRSCSRTRAGKCAAQPQAPY